MQGDSTSRRSEGRFYINSKATRVTVTVSSEDGSDVKYFGQLADLSLRGVKILINGRVLSGQEVELVIAVPSMGFQIERYGVIRWQQPRDATTWWTGCEILEPFDSAMIEGLAAADVLNRRRDPRYEVDQPAKVRGELSDQVVNVRLVNFSKGGFCVEFAERSDVTTDRLMLVLPLGDRDVTIPARVMWHGTVGSRFAVGCAFTTMDGFLLVREYAEPRHLARRRAAARRPRQPLSKWVGIALLVMVSVQLVQTLRLEPQLVAKARASWVAWVVEPIRAGLRRFEPPVTDPRAASEHDQAS